MVYWDLYRLTIFYIPFFTDLMFIYSYFLQLNRCAFSNTILSWKEIWSPRQRSWALLLATDSNEIWGICVYLICEFLRCLVPNVRRILDVTTYYMLTLAHSSWSSSKYLNCSNKKHIFADTNKRMITMLTA